MEGISRRNVSMRDRENVFRESMSACGGWKPRNTSHYLSSLQFPALVSPCEPIFSFEFMIAKEAVHQYRVNNVVTEIKKGRISIRWKWDELTRDIATRLVCHKKRTANDLPWDKRQNLAMTPDTFE